MRRLLFVPNRRRKKVGGSPVSFVINRLPFEAHLIDLNGGKLRKYSFAGPGTKLHNRLNVDGSWKSWSKPINALDEGAYHHDLCYRDYNDTATRNRCDNELALVARKFLNRNDLTKSERLNGNIVYRIMQGKSKIGVGSFFSRSKIKRQMGKKKQKKNLGKKAITIYKNNEFISGKKGRKQVLSALKRYDPRLPGLIKKYTKRILNIISTPRLKQTKSKGSRKNGKHIIVRRRTTPSVLRRRRITDRNKQASFRRKKRGKIAV